MYCNVYEQFILCIVEYLLYGENTICLSIHLFVEIFRLCLILYYYR